MARPRRSGSRWVWASTMRMGPLDPASRAATVVLVFRAELLRQRSLLGADLDLSRAPDGPAGTPRPRRPLRGTARSGGNHPSERLERVRLACWLVGAPAGDA